MWIKLLLLRTSSICTHFQSFIHKLPLLWYRRPQNKLRNQSIISTIQYRTVFILHIPLLVTFKTKRSITWVNWGFKQSSCTIFNSEFDGQFENVLTFCIWSCKSWEINKFWRIYGSPVFLDTLYKDFILYIYLWNPD